MPSVLNRELVEKLKSASSSERKAFAKQYMSTGGTSASLLETLVQDITSSTLASVYFYIAAKENNEATLCAWKYLQNRIMLIPSLFESTDFSPPSLNENESYLLYAARNHLLVKRRTEIFQAHMQAIDNSVKSITENVFDFDSYKKFYEQSANAEDSGLLLYSLWLKNFFEPYLSVHENNDENPLEAKKNMRRGSSTNCPDLNVMSKEVIGSATIVDLSTSTGNEYKAALIQNYSIMKLKMNDHSIRRQLAHIIFKMLQFDRNYGMEMWAECITFSEEYISNRALEVPAQSIEISDTEYVSMLSNESWLTDELLDEFLNFTKYNYERLSILFSAKDNVTNIIKKAVFGRQVIVTNGIRGIPYFLQYAIRGLIKQNDVFLANELIELAFGNPNIEPRGLGVLLSGAIPSVYSQDDIISDTAYQMLMHWIEKLNEEDAAILKVKMMDHLTIDGG